MSAELDAVSKMLRSVTDLGKRVAKDAAPGVLAANKATATAGTDAYGKAWKPKKADGQRALDHAADALSVRTTDDVIILTLEWPYTFHQDTRPILPNASAPLPKGMAEAIATSAKKALGA